MTPVDMARPLALIDSGTSRTRLRLWDGRQIVWQGERPVGAAHTARDGDTAAVRTALTELLGGASQQAVPEAVIASGMITSEVGLLGVPHLRAPASWAELARRMVRHTFPDLGTVLLVPGVKTLPDEFDLDHLEAADLLRGEEVEVLGLRAHLDLCGPVAFLHLGSHHKLILTDDAGIRGSRTNLNGELLAALSGHTILRGSLPALADLPDPDPVWWQAGLRAAQQAGLARAAFMVRTAAQILNATPPQAASFLLGALASQDLLLLNGAAVEQVVVYGQVGQARPLADHLRASGWEARIVDVPTAEHAAALGAAELYRRSPHARS